VRTLRQTAVAGCLASVLLAAACGQKPSETSVASVNVDLPGCKAAIASVDYGNLLVVPDETKSAIESYRSDWRAFCGEKPQRERPTMADLIQKAKTVEDLFGKTFETFIKARTTEERYAGADAVSDLVVKKYPSFVPGFEGSFWEQEYFRPSTEEFRKHVHLGTAEDKLFFDAGMPLQTEFPPWIDRTWDYGGCLRFGKYPWTETLEKIVQLKKSLQSDIYKKLTSEYEESLMGSVTSMGDVCTCEGKEAVLEDLQSVLAYLEKEPSLASYVPLVRSKLDSVQSRKITVNSEAEKHCSGG
jgi:hypothetical protein